MTSHSAQDIHGIRPKWQIKRSSVKLNEKTDKLGAGNFCDVYKASYVDNLNQKHVAAVKIHFKETEENHNEAQEARKSMLHEAKIMSNYNHTNVIEFFGVVCDSQPTWLVMEYCPGGSLYDHLCKYHEIPKLELLLYCLEVCRGMKYLHKKKCIHRDLATRNCLISAKGFIKISDFGLSKIFDDVQQQDVEEKLKHIPIRWMAPECLSRPPTFSFASDIWSFGVLIYEVFNKGVGPWPGDSDYKAMARKIRSMEMPKFPEATPGFIVKLVKEKLWLKSPDERVPFHGIIGDLDKYLNDNTDQFPPVQRLFVNKIEGVNRTQILLGTRDIINDDEETLRSSKSPSKKKSQATRASQKRYRNKKKSNGKEAIGTIPHMVDLSVLLKEEGKTGGTTTTTSAENLYQSSRQKKRKRSNKSPNGAGFGGE